MIPLAHDPFTLLFLLLVGHSLGDYAFQSAYLAEAKNQRSRIGCDHWMMALPAHALIHGGLVWIASGSILLGLLETAAHGVIDWGKNEGWFGYRTDQSLHVLCKILWVCLLVLLRH